MVFCPLTSSSASTIFCFVGLFDDPAIISCSKFPVLPLFLRVDLFSFFEGEFVCLSKGLSSVRVAFLSGALVSVLKPPVLTVTGAVMTS